jgi:hypothetical protein
MFHTKGIYNHFKKENMQYDTVYTGKAALVTNSLSTMPWRHTGEWR